MSENSQPSVDGSTSISAAFLEHQTFLKRFLYRFLSQPQDIEDVVQETFLKAYVAEKDRVIKSPKAFLFRVARNTALSRLTSQSRQIVSYIDDFEGVESNDDGISVEEQLIAQQRIGLFCQSALEMTPQCRRVFLLAKVYGFSYKEISKKLDISPSAVEKHVAKGLDVCNSYMKRVEGKEELVPNTSLLPGVRGNQ